MDDSKALLKGYLAQKQSLPMHAKAILSARRIKQYYEQLDGDVYVAFSGGLDSTVLLDLVWSLYPQVPAVFVDTGVEYPEIRKFVKSFGDRVVWVKPKKTFKQVISEYGFPIISKEQSQFLAEYRNTNSENLRKTRWEGNKHKRGKISEKWKFLAAAPFNISDRCCHFLKKEPAHRYEKETGRMPFVGTRAEESSLRTQTYMRHGCNSFAKGRTISKPLSVWLHQDVLDYIEAKNLPYSKIYDMGYDRTGCALCGFGCHLNSPNKFQLMKQTHPKLHAYGMDGLGMREVFEFWGVPFE
jgi:3'-phosphoadenosine 5'-phosphosulfate sulfotransferase (PAPS reductase)/FAD synthetase